MKLWTSATHVVLGLGLLVQAGCGGDAAKPVIADWHTNGNEARQLALQVHHPLLVAFLGSDWSEPSQTITQDVLNTETFKTFADQNLVLVKVDFPRAGNQPSEVAQLAATLAKQAQVGTLPTFMLVDPRNGAKIGAVVNFAGGANEFVAQLRDQLIQWQQVQLPAANNPPPQLNAPPASPPNATPAPSSLPSVDELRRQSAQPAADSGLTLPVLPTH